MSLTARPPLTFDFFPAVAELRVESDDVADGDQLDPAQVANIMGYSGSNLSPHLHWTGEPEGTKSFAVTIHDPDAPTGSGFWHWAVFNIPADVHELAAGAGSLGAAHLANGATQLRNDAGFPGYVGAAPPPGDPPHRYVTVVHAVDVEELEIGEGDAPAILGFNLRFHGLARGQVVPVFGS